MNPNHRISCGSVNWQVRLVVFPLSAVSRQGLSVDWCEVFSVVLRRIFSILGPKSLSPLAFVVFHPSVANSVLRQVLRQVIAVLGRFHSALGHVLVITPVLCTVVLSAGPVSPSPSPSSSSCELRNIAPGGCCSALAPERSLNVLECFLNAPERSLNVLECSLNAGLTKKEQEEFEAKKSARAARFAGKA
jgi:hypothetical protein